MKLVHVVADYGAGDLAFSEMISALARHLPRDAHWHTTPVESFNTLATGFIVGQLGLQEQNLRPDTMLIYANCAPRQDKREEREDNAGEGLLYARLNNGVPLLVVNSGWSLSFVRDQIAELWSLKIGDSGSQFRSRDIFPPVVGKVLEGDLSMRGQQLDALKLIPEIPTARVAYIDSFGNLKTTIRDGDPLLQRIKEGQRLDVRINGVQRGVTATTGSFGVREGDMAFAPGSSGHDRRFWEIFQRGSSAYFSYGNPRVGAPIELIYD
jgi:hypothetical protein